jgi:tryptophanase
VEPLRFTSRQERETILMKEGYNLFNIHADDVPIGFLTDSGTSAMSARQWGGMIEGDESYTASGSFYQISDHQQSGGMRKASGRGHALLAVADL